MQFFARKRREEERRSGAGGARFVSGIATLYRATRENRIIADRISLTSFISRKNRATHKESARITRIMGNIMNSRAFDSRNRRRVLPCFSTCVRICMYACMYVCAIEILVNFVSMISLFDSMIRRSRIWYFLSLSLFSSPFSSLLSFFFILHHPSLYPIERRVCLPPLFRSEAF